MMFSLSIRSHFMIAHSFRGEIFGPAQEMHGATYVVDAEFRRGALDRDYLVIDIGLATRVLEQILAELNYKNLDTLEIFQGVNTTTEYLAYHIFRQLTAAAKDGRLGAAGKTVESIKVTLSESHVARASYEASL